MEVRPPGPKTPLQSLLREYHDICEDINDIEGELMNGPPLPAAVVRRGIGRLFCHP
jgi:hypothetical protein